MVLTYRSMRLVLGFRFQCTDRLRMERRLHSLGSLNSHFTNAAHTSISELNGAINACCTDGYNVNADTRYAISDRSK